MDHLSPVPESVITKLPVLDNNQLGQWLQLHTEIDGLPNLDGVKVAIIGVQEDRRAYANTGCDTAADHIRPYLYQLFKGRWDFKVADLGNLYKGERHVDTIHALKEIIVELLKKDIIAITIGGSQELTYANYRAYDELEQMVNAVCVDARLDVGSEGRDLDYQSYVSHMVLQAPHNLYNFTNLGYQTYFNNPDEISLIDQLYFEAQRLGNLMGNIALAEPFLRDADLVSLDLASVRQSYSPGTFHSSPHGFSGEEFCAIARYAGMSDQLTQLGLYEYNPKLDRDGQSAHLCAHALWYFLEGISLRYNDFPKTNADDYVHFTVLMEDGDNLKFFKSPASGRWWMQVPAHRENTAKHQWVPCSKSDYDLASTGEIPARWWKAQQKS